MADINVDSIEEFERFYRRLRDFDRVLQEEFARIRSDWRRAEGFWKDTKGRKFGEDLHEVTRGIERYLKEAPQYETYLQRLIVRIRDVQNTMR